MAGRTLRILRDREGRPLDSLANIRQEAGRHTPVAWHMGWVVRPDIHRALQGGGACLATRKAGVPDQAVQNGWGHQRRVAWFALSGRVLRALCNTLVLAPAWQGPAMLLGLAVP